MSIGSPRRLVRLVAPLAAVSIALSFASPALGLGARSGGGPGAPAAVRKVCLERVDARAAHLSRIAKRMSETKWFTPEHSASLSAGLDADLAVIGEHRAAIQRAAWETELMVACRDGFAISRSIVAVDMRKVAIVRNADRVDASLADLDGTLDGMAVEIEGSRARGDDVAAVASALDALVVALTGLDAQAAALVEEVFLLAPADWDAGTAQSAFAEAKAAVAALQPLLGELRAGIAALEAMLNG